MHYPVFVYINVPTKLGFHAENILYISTIVAHYIKLTQKKKKFCGSIVCKKCMVLNWDNRYTKDSELAAFPAVGGGE
jgi:hypothetical protein